MTGVQFEHGSLLTHGAQTEHGPCFVLISPVLEGFKLQATKIEDEENGKNSCMYPFIH